MHRAVCHSFVFLAILYLINPYVALGAFLHTLLDALNSARDRGVEWLFPFTRIIKKAAYDANGERLPPDPKYKIYLLQNEMRVLTKQTTADIKPGPKIEPWRRTYGPTLSGGLFDYCVFSCSAAITLFLLALSFAGVGEFIDVKHLQLPLSFLLPFVVAASGIVIYFITGEIDRKRILREFKRTNTIYKILFFFSVSLIVSSILLAVIMNPTSFISVVSSLPMLAAASILIAFVAFATVKIYVSRVSSRGSGEPVIL